ncbi:pre-mRNA splicing factor component-domain-containing protein [Tirmania nivea]|nr:pre-mRNA splicing factor component-domain-containing protein [Tirmania nivea]
MPVVKGGVWSNVEDEILKASVSKYGLNQWQRVSSLLARKSAKQCKARWSEWLDPSIRKVEFSREEDEKLLHLAKLFPTQWRSIAKMVGRTASQCLDRYQKLLDEAEARESTTDLSLMGPEGASAPSADDIRKFRPGETDPDPETKPARPDAVDMDEDEKEMLSEARARLANTQGKKAKRKARERQLEESRRLAVLQKRRELKHAGINIKLVNRKKGEMDYNADIPFEKKPALGFYDTADEQIRNEKQRAAFDPRKAQSNSKRKADADADAETERSKRRNKGDKAGAAAAFASAAAAGKMQKIREAEQLSKRRSLVLPVPQVSESELEAIVKMGVHGEAAQQMARQSENDATRGLVFDYIPINTGAPIRTPRAPPEQDHIANEIRNIRALTETQSSLLGGENTPLHTTGTTGFDGIAPRKTTIATPNPLATPFRGGGGPGATPMMAATPMRTPRDTLAINNNGGMSEFVGITPRDQKLKEQSLKQQLRAGFASLPKPAEIDFELPDEDADTAFAQGDGNREMDGGIEEDAAIRDERERKRREAEEEKEWKRRTQVVQRGLPRPSIIDVMKMLEIPPGDDEVMRMVNQEAAALVVSDALRFPVKGGKVSNAAAARRVEKMDDEILARARREILLSVPPEAISMFSETFSAEWQRVHGNNLLPGLSTYDDADAADAAGKENLLESVHGKLLTDAEAANKLEKKLQLHFGGYMTREKLLVGKLADATMAVWGTRRDLHVFRTLQVHEEGGARSRLERLAAEAGYVEKREAEAQELYRRRREELLGLGGAV